MKILCALSGGIDSAVAAALLCQRGHKVIGVHLKFWMENFEPKQSAKVPENKCCSLEALEVARSTAEKLKIPFYVLNFREPFKRKVVDYFLRTYARSETPNPCVVCNREIKFGRLLTKMRELGCEKLATGHYARVRAGQLLRGVDTEKDQSYFLSNLTSAKLKHILFPIGNYKKSAVRKLARKFGLGKLGAKKESQGTCFFPEKEPQDFLARNLPKKLLKPGKIKTRNGEVVGAHRGLPLYTIGQRRGVELGGMAEPYYVAGFDKKKNELFVAPDRELFSKELKVKNFSWIGRPPKSGTKLLAQIRYRSPAVPATISSPPYKGGLPAEVPLGGTKAGLGGICKGVVIFTSPQRAITPGQTVAFYRGQTCLGSGVIC
ncbi:MAG: tRNA 2-thiouridine(34) synthase MnmA [Patescibacteria group bacterium]